MKRIKKSLSRFDFALFHRKHSKEPEDPDPEILKIANEGNSFAQLDIGKFYYSSSNRNGNAEKAFHWLSLSAEQGNMEAQFRLGDMYAFGDGAEKNEFTAYDWYLKSAIQGFPKALTRLHNLYHGEKSMYCRGQRDSKEAKWTAADFKKENNIRELYEYRVQQLGSELINTKEYFTKLLLTCREQINDGEVENKEDAYLKLGFLYQHGYGIRKIKTRAIEFYRLAAEKGNADAAYNLGHIFHHSPKLKWNYREAFKWYTIATENGQVYAQSDLAFLYLKGLGTEIDYSKAIYLYTKAAESRNVNTMISLARMFRQGEIVKQDHKKAAEWYKKAIIEGSTVAQSCLELLIVNEFLPSTETGMHFENESSKVYSKKGLSSKLRLDISKLTHLTDLENIKKLAMNAMRRDGYAMLEIGMKYYNGNGFVQDKDVAFKWFRNAAKSGITAIQCSIAKLYKDGDCVEQNYHKASIWYKEAARKGDTHARYNLGKMYYHGLGVRKDPLEASRWYTLAANKNNSDAQYQLGILRENGEGLRKDLPDALRWFNISFRQKNSKAVYRLAQMYENGTLEKHNSKNALSLYEKAAQLGNIDAQMKLASIYGKEESQQYDKKTVFKYYEMAANQGSPEAKYGLAIMYLNGRGVRKDFIQAYRLFKESSNLGYKNAINLFNIPIDYSKTPDVDYHKIADMFKVICEKGIDSLEYNLGYHYNNSTYDNMDLKHKWLLAAAEKHVPEANYILAFIYEERNDLSSAIKYYKSARRLGNIDAIYKLAGMYLDGHGVFQNFKKAFSLFSDASDKGHIDACDVLGTFEIDNQNEKMSLIKKMIKVSAKSGNTISQYKLGIRALNNESTKVNTREAKKWLEMASRGGFIEASYKLGLIYEENPEIEHNHQEIIRLYQSAADKGHEEASFRLAQIYHLGEKVERDYSKAYVYFTSAAQEGHQSAQLAIHMTTKSAWEDNENRLNSDLKELHFDYESYFHMWEHVAEEGNVTVQYRLGVLYEENGGDSNLTQALKWYSKAACSSHDAALYNLGRLYESGQGVPRDYIQAIAFYEKASDLHNDQALHQLGVIYQDGKGVNTDLEKARNYYTKAAKKGNSTAQFSLGKLYENLKFPLQNRLEALKQYSLSTSQGNEDAESWLNIHYDESYDYDPICRRRFKLLSRIFNDARNADRQNHSLLGPIGYELGNMYYYGHGTPINYKEAWKNYSKSLVLYGDDRARERLTIKYESIDISIKDSHLKKLEMFEALVDQLPVEVIYELGSIYYHGIYTNSSDSQANETQAILRPDNHKSSKYFRMIIKRDLPEISSYYMYCSYYLGMMYFVDIEQTSDSSKARYYLVNALKSGSIDAQPFLDYINSKNIDNINEAALFKKVFEWHDENQDPSYDKLIYNLGWMHDEGLGTERNYKKAIHYYTIVASNDSTSPYSISRQTYLDNDGTKSSYITSAGWYIKPEKQDYANANYRLGNIYYNNKGIRRRIYKLALQYYERAAKLDHGDAQAQIGVMYSQGLGVEQNYTTAIEWYTKSTNMNSPIGYYYLGNTYFNGEGVTRTYKLALKYYKRAAKLDHGDAQAQIGVMYNQGYGVKKNYTTAIEWYTKAAEMGSPIGCYYLGNTYFNGEGVTRTYKLALKYYKRAAKLDHGDAQAQIGVMYNQGYGVKKNYTTAIEWYTKAAKMGSPIGCYYLGDIYFNGKGVNRDFAIALKWFHRVIEFKNSNTDLWWLYQAINEKPKERHKYLFFKDKRDAESDSHDKIQGKYSKVSESFIHREAHRYLGIMYQTGLGTNKDYAKAQKHMDFLKFGPLEY